MGKVARSVVDTILGEAVSGSRTARFEDMAAIASTIANRAAATGVSMEEIVSAPNQYAAYGKALPAGVEKYRGLAVAALEHVQTKGPTTTAQYYATPDAIGNLPNGLQPVGQTRGHMYFEDPQGRAVATAVGYRQLGQIAYDIMPEETAATAPASALDAIFGLGGASASSSQTALDDELDAVFGLGAATQAPASLDDDLDTVFGFEPGTTRTSAALGTIDDPNAEWDGTFSNPLGAITDRATDEFGFRNAPKTSLGVGSTNHMGIDLSAEPNQQGYAAEAVGPGTVISAGPAKGYGNLVEIEHPNGYTSRYGHLGTINVNVGDEIARGTPIGTVGTSGRSTGPHLHFEVRDQIGNPVDPRSVVDMSMRDTISPTSRPMSPMEQRSVASAYSGMAASLADAGVLGVGRGAPSGWGAPQDFDVARFGPSEPSPARFGGTSATAQVSPLGGVSSPFSPAGGYASAQVAPSADRFGPRTEPSAERFGRVSPTSSFGEFSGPFSPADSYATATGPVTAPAEMQSTAKSGRLSSAVTPSSATPMASNPSQPMSSAGAYAFGDFGVPTSHVNTTSVAPSSLGLLPSTAQAPAGPFSAFNPVPADFNAVTNMANTMAAQPLTISMPNISPMALTPAFAPKVTPMVTPMARVPQQVPRSAPTPAPRPSFSAYDVYSGKAPAGYQASATGGNVVSRDQFGNTTVTNKFGASTVTDPSGRQMAVWDMGDVGKKAPGIVGAVVGGAIAGAPGAIAGYNLGNRVAGQPSGKSGGLGGLGGFLADLFGGNDRGGSSDSGGGSRGGGGRGSSGPAGRDRDHSGNR